MSTGATIAIGAVVVFVLVVVFLATTSMRRDRADAVGVLSRETKRRDSSTGGLEPALALFQAPKPGGTPLAREKTIAVVQAWEKSEAAVNALLARMVGELRDDGHAS